MKKILAKALKLYKAGDLKQALIEVGKSVRKKDTAEARNLLGAIHQALGDQEAAIENFRRAVKLAPNKIEAMNNLAVALQDGTELEKSEAEKLLTKLLNANPTNQDLKVNLLKTLIKSSKIDQAINLAIEILETNDSEIHTLVLLADIYRSIGKQKEAVEYYRRASEIIPKNSSLLYRLACTQSDLGLMKEAALSFQNVIKLNPENDAAFLNLSNCLKKLGQTDEALKLIEHVIKRSPKNFEAFNSRATLRKQQGNTKAAIDDYRHSVKLNPRYSIAWNNLGVCFLELDDLESCIAAYNKALTLTKNKAQREYILSNILATYEKYNQLDKVEFWLEKVGDYNVQWTSDLLVHKARFQLRKKQHELSKSTLLKVDQKNLSGHLKSTYFSTLGKVSDKLMRYNEAADAYLMLNRATEAKAEFLQYDVSRYLKNQRAHLNFLKELAFETQSDKWSDKKVFMIGFPRSGTTLLDIMLSSHKDIIVIEEKPILDDAMKGLDRKQLICGEFNELELANIRANYEAEEHKYLGDKTAANVVINKLPLNILKVAEIERLFPGSKYIFSLRNPLDSILSNWMQDYQLNQAMACMTQISNIVDLYDVSMSTYQCVRDKAQLDDFVVKYEDLTDNYQAVLKELTTYLGLQWSDDMLTYREQLPTETKINTPSYSQVVEPVYQTSKERWRNYNQLFEPYYGRMEMWMKLYGYQI